MVTVALVAACLAPRAAYFYEVCGIHVADLPSILFFPLSLAGYCFVLSQFRVLTDPSVKRLFHPYDQA